MTLKRVVDLLMTVLLLFLMAFQVTGEAAHEWLGMGMFVLFLIHQWLNCQWYRALFKGRYGLVRSLWTAVNVLLLVAFLVTVASGMTMSRHALAFLDFRSGTYWARLAHLAGSYWSFILTSLHLGLHWSMVAGRLLRGWKGAGLSAFAVLTAGYGLHLFLVKDISSYLFLTTQFAFLDYEKASALVLAENLAMMSFWVLLAYQGYKAVAGLASKRWRSLLQPALALMAAGGFSALLSVVFGGAPDGSW